MAMKQIAATDPTTTPTIRPTCLEPACDCACREASVEVAGLFALVAAGLVVDAAEVLLLEAASLESCRAQFPAVDQFPT